MPVEGQAGFGAQRIAGAKAAGFQSKRSTGSHDGFPEVNGFIGVNEELKGHLLAGVTRARDHQIEPAHCGFAKLSTF
ncbi:hypothetical protein SDC9_202620 [bioreactor metagenome]|uniref:Uncharacterized protein n=1 Tax=bioreactor metagenome TaxID=1076179 RepID=A0A645IU53_9ZZZZ